MQKWDNALHRLLSQHIRKGQPSKMTRNDRDALLELIGAFMLRSPDNKKRCDEMVKTFRYNRRAERRDLLLNRSRYLAEYRRSRPENFEKLRSKLGEREAENFVFVRLQQSIMTGRVEASQNPADMFYYMLKSGNHVKYSQHLWQKRWTWIYAAHEFVIGDNPVLRRKVGTQIYNYGIGLRDVEIYFPFGKNLSLKLHQDRSLGDEVEAMEEETLALNRLQIKSAVRMVYGPSSTALRPDGWTGFE